MGKLEKPTEVYFKPSDSCKNYSSDYDKFNQVHKKIAFRPQSHSTIFTEERL